MWWYDAMLYEDMIWWYNLIVCYNDVLLYVILIYNMNSLWW